MLGRSTTSVRAFEEARIGSAVFSDTRSVPTGWGRPYTPRVPVARARHPRGLGPIFGRYSDGYRLRAALGGDALHLLVGDVEICVDVLHVVVVVERVHQV